MLMLFLIIAVSLEIAHEINRRLALSPHYRWSTVLRRGWGRGGRGCWIMGLNRWYHRCAGGSCPLCDIFPACFITARLCAPHTCKTAFWWRGAKWKRNVRGEDEWRWAPKWKDCFHSSLFIQITLHTLCSDCLVFTVAPIYTWELPSSNIFLLFGKWTAYWSNRGLIAWHLDKSSLGSK